MNNLEKYIKVNHPLIWNEYNRYLNEDPPNIGETVVSLHAGFGGLGNQFLTVSEIDEDYITLTNGSDEYICSIKTWYKDIRVVS